jgi:hypothetical protein
MDGRNGTKEVINGEEKCVEIENQIDSNGDKMVVADMYVM